MNTHSHPEQFSLSDTTSHAPGDLAWDGALSAPDIQVFQRREVEYPSLLSEDTNASLQADGPMTLQLQDDVEEQLMSTPDEELLDDDMSDLCTSFVEDVFEPPHSTLGGRIVFGIGASICVIALLGMALFHIWAQGQATRLGFTYSQISKKHTRLKEERRLLKLQLAKLRNPMRLARIARQQLGMRLPDRAQIISEEQVATQLRVQREINKLRKGPRLASNKRTHMVR